MKFKIEFAEFLRRAAAVLAVLAVAVGGAACSDDEGVSEEPYVYFADGTELLTYTIAGGSKSLEMYCNQGPWVIETAYPEDEEWIDVWPNEGSRDARFKITVDANTGAYSRTSSVNVVVAGRIIKSIVISQAGGDARLALDMGSDNMNASARKTQVTVSLDTNIGWLPEALGDAVGWLSFGEATETTQVVDVAANDGAERTGTVRFQAIGTGFESLYVDVHINQFDMEHDPYNGTHKTIREIVESLPAGVSATVDENVWVEGYVTSDPAKLNFEANRMFIQDESGRGLQFEFASAKDNVFAMGEKLKIHLYNADLVIDEVTRGRKVASFTSGAVFDRTTGGGIEPVELDYIENLDMYENTLVTLRNVEFSIPMGTYVNIDERTNLKAQGNPSALPYCDGTHLYGHLLCDAHGNTIKLYSRDTFLDRVAAVMPKGSGPVTGIVSKYTKNGVTQNILTLRSHADNGVAADGERLTNTLVQFGPLTGYEGVPQLLSSVGTAQLKSSVFERVAALGSSDSGSNALGWSFSYARRDPAEVTLSSTGVQSVTPAINNSASTPTLINIFFCVEGQKFWNATGSTINREGMGQDELGEAWIVNVDDFRCSGGNLALVFSAASSQTGPMYFDLEWADDELAPISQWHKFGEHINPDWYTCLQCQQYTYPLPDELKSKTKFTIRMRVSKNLRAGVGMTNGKESGVDVLSGGSPRFGYWAITELK